MSHLLFNKRGIGLVEVVIAIFLVTVGVLAILSMQPSAWTAVGKSDYLGRGAGILHRELERNEALIMNNPCNDYTGNSTNPVTVSGLTGMAGDATYTVNTNITKEASTHAYRVTVTVTWPNQLAHGYRNLTESIIVSQPECI